MTTADRFRRFAERECQGSSLLYERLSLAAAEDPWMLALAEQGRPGQPLPNLFFGAVHYMLLRGKRHQLAMYYASLVDGPCEPTGAYPLFKDFCIRYERELTAVLGEKLVQTNEVRRCAYLYPGFCLVYRLAGKPLALVELGSSAGMQLGWDRYEYRYEGLAGRYGQSQAELVLSAKATGPVASVLCRESPPVASRVGIDLHVNRASREDDVLWLKALIWPEHADRRELFERAMATMAAHPAPQLIEGDALGLLEAAASQAAPSAALCVFHTHVANQWSAAEKRRLADSLRRIGKYRDVFHLYNNIHDSYLHLDYCLDGVEYRRTLAETDGHGRWFRWLE